MEQVKKRVLYGILILVTLFIFRIAWLDVGTGEKIFAFLGQCATGIPGLMGWYNSIQEEKKKTDAGEQKSHKACGGDQCYSWFSKFNSWDDL